MLSFTFWNMDIHLMKLRNMDGRLHHASEISSFPIAQHIIEKGVNIEAKDDDQYASLHYACEFDHNDCSISHWKRSKY